jgi:gliding motility-associated lipoprotein GldH
MMRNKYSIIAWVKKFNILVLLLMFNGCVHNTIYERNQKIESEGWNFDNQLVFITEIADTTSLHDIYINVRNNTSYPYTNLILFFTTEFPDGRQFRDTVECILADRSGQWTGKGFGTIKSNSFHFRRDVWFPMEGEHTFTIQHAMREEYLQGLNDIGIRIDRK